VKIKGDVQIYGLYGRARDYTVIDNYNRIERSIIWRNNYIGECELRGVIISRQCSIKPSSVPYEGVVIGDNCAPGEGCALYRRTSKYGHINRLMPARLSTTRAWSGHLKAGAPLWSLLQGPWRSHVGSSTPEYAGQIWRSSASGQPCQSSSYVAFSLIAIFTGVPRYS